MGLVIFIKKINLIIKNSVYFIKEIVIPVLYRKYWGLFTNKTKRCVFLIFFLKDNFSSFEAWIEELIKQKKIKERRLPIYFKRISPILQFYFRGDC